MKVPPDHYKGPQATSKGHAPLLIPVAAMGKCKQANEFQSRHYGHPLLIIHERNRPDSAIQGCPTLKDPRNIIRRPQEALDTQSELIFVNGMVHLPHE